jgi:pilus assembly protein Flp/PilA
MTKFVAFLRDESGASAAEYVLILAILGAAIVAAMTAFGGSIASALTRAGTVINGVL